MKAAAIVNPQSGGGRTIRVWREFGDRLARYYTDLKVFFTERSQHATEFARQIATSGFERLIVVGGDGTLHEVVNGLFEKGQPNFEPHFAMGILNGGRGCDFVKTLDMGKDPHEMLRVAIGAKVHRIDIGEVQLDDAIKYYINSSTFGLGGQVAKDVQAGSPVLPPQASYLAAAARGVFRAKPHKTRLWLDGHKVFEGQTQNIFVCNGRYSGGGMLWSPKAQLDDGLLDVLIVRDLNRFELLSLAPRLYTGTLSHARGVSLHTAQDVRIESDEPQWLELDGETYRTKSARFRALERVLPLLVK